MVTNQLPNYTEDPFKREVMLCILYLTKYVPSEVVNLREHTTDTF